MASCKMYRLIACAILLRACAAEVTTFETDMNFRVEPGDRTCFFEKGKVGQVMEASYQVIDGQHGDLDISFDILAPDGKVLSSDYKKPYNSIIKELEQDGDYVFCLDNSFSVMNSKLVFVYVLIEEKAGEKAATEAGEKGAGVKAVTQVAETTGDGKGKEVLEWTGKGLDGKPYFLEVELIAESLSRTLKHVVRARHLLDVLGAGRARDSYAAFEHTFIVDVWSAFQITCMCLVGTIQVYMIKNLFEKSTKGMRNYL